MSDPNTTDSAADVTPVTPTKPRSPFTRRLLLGGAVALALVAGAGAVVAGGAMHHGWRHGPPTLENVENRVHRALDYVDATPDQTAKIDAIVAATFKEMAPMRDEMKATRDEALALLKAETVDRAAAEKLRAERIARMDETSKKLVAATLDIAEILTPAQRAKLAAKAEMWRDRGGPDEGGRHHGWRD